MNSPHQPRSPTRIGAGAAGAGGGTLVVAIATSLPDTNILKPWLLLLAPSITVGLTAAWIWAQARIVEAFREREFKAAVARARAACEAVLANPATSAEHRAAIRAQLEEIEAMTVGRHLEKLRALQEPTTQVVRAPNG